MVVVELGGQNTRQALLIIPDIEQILSICQPTAEQVAFGQVNPASVESSIGGIKLQVAACCVDFVAPVEV